MAASAVYFDDKSVQMFITAESSGGRATSRGVHRIYPAIVTEGVGFRLYYDEAKQH
jgi:hypothetical protein